MKRAMLIAIFFSACSASSSPPTEAPTAGSEPNAEPAPLHDDARPGDAPPARSVCAELATKLCTDLGQETETCALVKERTPQIPAARCQEMLGNYDKVIAELKAMEKQNAPLSAADAAKQRAGDGPSFGPPDAKVAVVEYADFECPFCSQAAATLTKLKERYGKTVRFVFRQYPLPMHPNAQLAAEASLAAHAQKKFWKYHDLLFANQAALDRASLVKYATQAGLNTAVFTKALDAHTYAAAVDADMKLGDEIGIAGTPTMIVGTKRVPAKAMDFNGMSAMIDEELRAAGVPVPPP